MLSSPPKYEDDYLTHEIENGILLSTYKNGLEINLSVAKKILSSRLAFSGNNCFITLIDGRKLKSIDWEARKYFNSEEGRKGIIAAAFLGGSLFTTNLGNFFLKVTYARRSFPVRLFTNKEEALKWLEKYKKINVKSPMVRQ